ncbi:hypothetical protein SporoP37_02720 [Sporosarcina sp. P37]|nr:hypothetical protein SporoP37_02720 [Sporosarcina sp. P37]
MFCVLFLPYVKDMRLLVMIGRAVSMVLLLTHLLQNLPAKILCKRKNFTLYDLQTLKITHTP